MTEAPQARYGTAAQWAALNPRLARGVFAFSTDTGEVRIGNGSDLWSVLPAIGGGGIPTTLVDAKGDLLVGSGADAVGRLAVAPDGNVLTTDAASPLGLKWAAGGGGSGAPEVEIGTTEPTDPDIALWMDTNTVGSGGGWSALDARYLRKAGDTATGNLILNADPAVALGAATKQYVDERDHPRASGSSAGTSTALTTSYARIAFGGAVTVAGGITSPSTDVFRLPKAGRYLVTLRLMPASNGAASTITMAIGNSSNVTQVEFADAYVPASAAYRVNGAFVYQVTAQTDFVLLAKSSVSRSSNYNAMNIDYLGKAI